jgi:elongation factor G
MRFVRQTGGRGQYAHVILELRAAGAGKGFEFVDKVVGGAVPKEFIPAIEQGIRESMENGVLGGYPLVDIKATLTGGSYPRSRQLRAGLQDRRLDGAARGRGEGRARAARAVMKIEVVVPEATPAT